MLCIMILSSLSAWEIAKVSHHQLNWAKQRLKKMEQGDDKLSYNRSAARCMSTSQLLLGALALTSYHVQIVTRLSSGYPLWYLWSASIILEDYKLEFWGQEWHMGKGLIKWIVLYGLIQGGLFASFLPPA